jgi:hypothetical protein
MTLKDLLGAQRPVYVLAEKPSTAAVDSKQYWYFKLGGLLQADLKDAVGRLREQQRRSVKTKSQDRDLKPTSLYHSLARSLGAESYDHWLAHEQQKIADLLAQHSMNTPADLINWKHVPGFCGPLKARQISDRIFNSGLPVPRRIFTGVGRPSFAPSGYGRLDIDAIAGKRHVYDEDRYHFCRERSDEVLLHVEDHDSSGSPLRVEVTGRALMLNAVSEFVGCFYNMLGSNLVNPALGDPVMRSYKMAEEERAFELKIYEFFREEIESNDAGWVEVIEVPGNSNLVFLKGSDGAFDWVIRDQRDEALSSNPLHPFFDKSELPTAMDTSKLSAHRYFTRGHWQEELEHNAECRHYENGGSASDWPGYEKLIERELLASRRVVAPKRVSGPSSQFFVSHRSCDHQLMVSPLITIDQFNSFVRETGWDQTRLEKAEKANIELESDLMSVNSGDPGTLPVSVTWLDAVAFCRDYESRHGLPVRLIEPEEWKQIAPLPTVDMSKVDRSRVISVENGELPNDPIYEQLGWAVIGGDGQLGENSAHCYMPNGVMSFVPNLQWSRNSEGLPFLSVAGFFEWLSWYQDGYASFAYPAGGSMAIGAGIFGPREPARLAMRHKGGKVGFRICYIADLDA